MFRFKVGFVLIFFVIVVIVSILVATLVFATPHVRGSIYVEEVGFRKRGIDALEYLANIYVDEKLVRSIYLIVPTYNVSQQPLRIHIPIKEESAVKRLKITFSPPIGRVIELAWVATTYNTQVRFYKEGANIILQCDDMGMYGKATVSLEFIPQYSKPDYFKGTTITIDMTLEYKNQQYIVIHNVIIS